MKTMTQTGSLMTHRTPLPQRQRGTILFISLTILLLLTIIGVSSLRNVTMEERMAGNLRDGDLALQAAEAALRDGENWISTNAWLPIGADVEPPAECGTLGSPCSTVWAAGVLPDLSYQIPSWWTTHGVIYTNDGGGSYLTGGNTSDAGPHANDSQVTLPPRFIIQYQNIDRDNFLVGHSSTTTGPLYYRVTAHGFGGTLEAESLLQSSVPRRFN